MTDEANALAFYPFEGDDLDVSQLSDKFVVTRKPHKCQWCFAPIPAGTRVRALSERNNEERKVMTFYFGPKCCSAMASAVAHDGRIAEFRYRLHDPDNPWRKRKLHRPKSWKGEPA